MKQYYIGILFSILILNPLSAQLIDVANSLNLPTKIANTGDDLYIVLDVGGITKVNINDPLPVPFGSLVIGGLSQPNGIAIKGNDLFIVENGSGKISKIDLTATTATTSDFLTGLNSPIGLFLKDNTLYFSEVVGGKISKVDLTATSPSVIEIISGPNRVIDSFAISGNYLYFSDNGVGKISKINLSDPSPTEEDVLTGLNLVSGLEIIGNNLYYSESGDFKVSKIDITIPNPSPEEVISTPGAPVGLLFLENELYISIRSAFKVSKLPQSALSIEDFDTKKELLLFPNPSNDLIKVYGIESNMKYTIFNTLGTQILNGVISTNGMIDIKSFKDGIYFLKFENGTVLNFIKK